MSQKHGGQAPIQDSAAQLGQRDRAACAISGTTRSRRGNRCTPPCKCRSSNMYRVCRGTVLCDIRRPTLEVLTDLWRLAQDLLLRRVNVCAVRQLQDSAQQLASVRFPSNLGHLHHQLSGSISRQDNSTSLPCADEANLSTCSRINRKKASWSSPHTAASKPRRTTSQPDALRLLKRRRCRAMCSGPKRLIFRRRCECGFCPGTVLCGFRRPNFTNRLYDCCSDGAVHASGPTPPGVSTEDSTTSDFVVAWYVAIPGGRA